MSAHRWSDGPAPKASESAGAALASAAAVLATVSATPRLDAELLLAFVTGRTRGSLLAFPERAVEPAAAARFAALIARRSSGEPFAYLTGEREFFSLPLDVSSDVLVPRAETELLVELTLARIAALSAPAVLDLGTGSGAIALAVRHAWPAAQVTGSDTSAAALAVARANGARLGLEVRWRESRWFESLAGERFDVLVSNPPYVRSAEVCGALAFEPRLALDGGADGLDAFRVLFAEAPPHLNVGAALLVEHGAGQRRELEALAVQRDWRVVAAHDDLAGHARVLELERSRLP